MSIKKISYISEKTGKSVTRYMARVFDPVNNKDVYSKRFSTRKEAIQEELRMMRLLGARSGEFASNNLPTVREVYDLYIKTAKKNLAERTWKAYAYWWTSKLEAAFGDLPVNRVGSMHILSFFGDISEKYSPETSNKIYNVLTNIFSYAKNTLKLIDANPMDGIQRSHVKHKAKATWTEADIAYFLTIPELKESPYYGALVLYAATGMRPGELCGLLESDLLPTDVLTLHQGMNAYGHETEMKNDRSHRALKLSHTLANILRESIEKKNALCLAIGVPRNEYLFCSTSGAPLRPDVLSRHFRSLVNTNNRKAIPNLQKGPLQGFQYRTLTNIRLYDIRHSFATNLLEDGQKSKVVSEIMGNSVSTMELHYAHLREQMHETALAGYADKIVNA